MMKQRTSNKAQAAQAPIHTAVAAIVLCAMALTGCGGPKVNTFVHSDADLDYYERVGVVPFRTLTADRFAGEKFTVEFNTSLYVSGLFDVVDQGIFVNELTQIVGSRSPADGLDGDQLQKIAEATGVQGVFMGTVSHYEMQSSGNDRYPVISVEAHLVDVATGTVVWSCTVTERGGPKTPVFGVGETRTLGALAQDVSQRLVRALE